MKNATKNVNQDIKLIKSNSHSIKNYLPRSYKIELSIIGFLIFIIVFIFISTKIWEFYLESPFCLKKHKKRDKKSKLAKDIAKQFQKGQYFKKYFKEIFNRSFAELIMLIIGSVFAFMCIMVAFLSIISLFWEIIKDFNIQSNERRVFVSEVITTFVEIGGVVGGMQKLISKIKSSPVDNNNDKDHN